MLIMAAGGSKRMGDIKQLLPWKDSNFLLESIKTVQESDATTITVVLGAHAEIITKECNLIEKDVQIMKNPNWSLGLGNSIGFAVKTLLDNSSLPDGILICLADQPLLRSSYLKALIKHSEKDPSKIIATNYGNRVGVPALFPKFLYPNLVLLEGDQGAKDLLNANSSTIVRLNAGIQALDVDTKLEYNQLIQQINSKNIE